MKRFKLQTRFRNQWRDLKPSDIGEPFYFTDREEAEKMLKIVTKSGDGRVVQVDA